MAGPLDPKRLDELRGLIGPNLGSVVVSLIQSMAEAIGQADGALAAGRLSEAAYAAHCCRNDALMVGATQLQEALSTLEASTRAEQPEPARAALDRVRQLWPETLAELERVAGPDGHSA